MAEFVEWFGNFIIQNKVSCQKINVFLSQFILLRRKGDQTVAQMVVREPGAKSYLKKFLRCETLLDLWKQIN